MVFAISFSGGVSHKDAVPTEKQVEIAAKIATVVKSVLETNAVGGSGTVTVGDTTHSFGATTTYSI